MENRALQHVRVFPLTVLKDITGNFSEEHVIGHGASGVVYKGVLENGEMVAVKKLHNRYDSSGKKLGNGEAQFLNELMNLFGVQHQNIIRLVGYCYETCNIVTEFDGKRVLASEEERILCFEYMPCGSLKDHLSDESCELTWHERYNIIKGICEGLKYLHTGSENPIYHLDLKPENILLDKNKIPKIGDFGISRLPAAGSMQTFVTQNISGSLGYMPPEYLFMKQISPKFDIFSLGVIMIHIIAGHEGNQNYPFMPSGEFIEHVQENWRQRLQAMVPPHILEQVRKCAEIASRCVEVERERRPNITEIVDELNKVDIDQSSDVGQKQSRIIISTQQVEIARLCTEKPYQVSEFKPLSCDQTMYLFHKKNSEEQVSIGSVSVPRVDTNEAILAVVDKEKLKGICASCSAKPVPDPKKVTTAEKNTAMPIDEIQEGNQESNNTDEDKVCNSTARKKFDRSRTLALADEVICGRETEKSILIKLVGQPDNDQGYKVISVWGMGGLGKTTLV